MSKQIVILKGDSYLRSVEMLGDVEKITYFHVIKTEEDYNYKDLYLEIYDQYFAHDLEVAYEDMCTFEFTPKLFFI